MTQSPSCDRLVIAVSSRALFDLRESDHVFQRDGERAHTRHQRAHESVPLRPGRVFHLVRKLLALNMGGQQRAEVILLSPDSADMRLRILLSIGHHGLPITRAAFTRGAPCHRHAAAFGVHLFLSTDADDVRLALDHSVAAATVQDGAPDASPDDIVRIAFDGDAVLFSDEAEQVFANAGLDAFIRSEREARHRPLAAGPFQPLLAQLYRLQALHGREACPIRTALVTARSVSAHERALRTLRAWRIEVDEVMFLAGTDKGPALRSFGADIFFDDQQRNCDRAAAYVTCAHVPYGTRNRPAQAALQLVA
jgi:5'-nucleotidase